MKKVILLLFIGLFAGFSAFAQTYTGNGTWYDTTAKNLYAKHASLPFGTRVRITNLDNNKSVICTINGRIAQSDDQLVDVAQPAAENIGMSPTGSTKVKVEVLTRGAEKVAAAEPPKVETPPVTPAPVVKQETTPQTQTPPAVQSPNNYTWPAPSSTMAVVTPPVINSPPQNSTTINTRNPQATQPQLPVPQNTNNNSMFLSGFALGLMANNNKNTGAGSAPSSPVVVAPSYNNASPAGPSYNNANPSYNNNNATSPSGANNNSQPNNAAPNSQPNNLASLPVAPVTTPRASSTTPGSAGSPSATTSYYLVPSGSSYIAVPANTASGVEAAKDSKGNTISINIDLGKGKGATPEATVTNTATPAPAAGTAIAPVAPPPAASAPEKLPPPSPVQTGMEPAPRKEAPVVVSGTPPSAAASMKIVPFMPPADNGRCYRVQVGAFTSMEGVNEAVERVQQAGYTAFYEKAGKFYRVVILHISASEMREVAKKLQSVGFSELWLRPEGV